jgi:hypothetical protein
MRAEAGGNSQPAASGAGLGRILDQLTPRTTIVTLRRACGERGCGAYKARDDFLRAEALPLLQSRRW